MTLRELAELLEGYQYRDEVQFRYLGWHAANVMNCWTKKGKAVTIDKLCGKPKHTRDPDKPPPGVVYLEGEEHERIKEYFQNAKRRRSKSKARARDQKV